MFVKNIFLFLQVHITVTFLLQNETLYKREMGLFLKNESVLDRKIAVVSDMTNNCRRFTDLFLKSKRNSYVVIGIGKNIVSSKTFVSKSTYVFLDNFVKFNETLIEMNKYNFIYLRGKFKFIICSPVKSDLDLYDFLELVWKNDILNFVFVYYNHGINVVGYNPFNRTIFNYTNTYEEEDIFPDKLVDMYGYKLKVSMFKDFPRNEYVNGQFYGADIVILEIIIKYLNATLEYVLPDGINTSFAGIKKDVVSKNSQFSFVSIFATAQQKNVNFSYPLKFDDVVVVVPKAGKIPQYMNTLSVFEENVVLLFQLCLVIVILLLYFLKKRTGTRHVSIGRAFFEIWILALNNPLWSFKRNVWEVKILFCCWMSFTFLLNSLYRSSLTSATVMPKYYQEFNKLSELRAKKINIYLPQLFINLLPQDASTLNNLKPKPRDEIVRNLFEGKLESAYALPNSYIENILMEHKRRNGETIYHILEEHLIPGLGVYMFSEYSPYIRTFNKLFLKNKEFGLSRYKSINQPNRNYVKLTNVANKYTNTVFTLYHLQTPFLILLMGIAIATLTFICELIYFQYSLRKNRLQYLN